MRWGASFVASLLIVVSSLHAQPPKRSVGTPSAQGRAAMAMLVGRVADASGAPIAGASVIVREVKSLESDGAPLVASLITDHSGRFNFAASEAGSFFVLVTGPGHEWQQNMVQLANGTPLEVRVRLARQALRKEIDTVRASVDVFGFGKDSLPVMQRQRDGTYALDVRTKQDTIAYSLVGVAARGSYFGTQTTRVASTGSYPEYRSVINAVNGVARIIFDPAKLTRDSSAARVTFDGGAGARIAQVFDSTDQFFMRMVAPMREGKRMEPHLMDWTAETRAVLSGLTAERDPLVRQARLLQVVVLASFGAKIPPAIGAQALREIPPSAAMWRSGASLRYAAPLVAQQLADSTLPLWRFSRGVALTAGDSARMRADAAAVAALMERLVANTQDPRTRASFIATAIEVTSKWQPATFERLMSVMQTEYADRQGTAEILRRFSANRLLRVGVDMPSFNLRMLGNDSVSITNQSVKGKFTLVDFWATWCAPCLSEMPDLHEAYDKFSSRGFQILSISADASPSVVTRFREKWPMPWMHGFVKGALESDELRALQINSLPRALLLDPAGRIVAMDGELRGAALQVTLERLLAASGR